VSFNQQGSDFPMKMYRLIATMIGLLALPLQPSCGVRSPSPVVINEVMPSNKTTCGDEFNERNDWIELYNKGSEALDLGGYTMTDDTASPRKSVLPDGVVIEAQSVLLFWADKTPDQGKTHLSFKLSSKLGEEVVLYDPDGKLVDQYRWSKAYPDISFARVPDGTGDFVDCLTPTCGKLNGTSCGN
jgi:hypothetical protein